MSYLYELGKLTIKRVQKPSDVPDEPHYAVIVYSNESVYIEGDERSKSCPGHGYPAHTETFNTFCHYVTVHRADWEVLIGLIMKDDEVKDKFVAFKVAKVAKVRSKVVVEVE